MGLVFLTVLYNDWNRAFFEAIQDKDFDSFGMLLARFCVLAALFIAGAVFRRYLTLMLQMRWRVWLTRRFLDQSFDIAVRVSIASSKARMRADSSICG